MVELGATLALPAVDMVPDQPPEATQSVALLDDQASRELWPALIVVGFAVSETMGAVAVTVTFAELETLPPEPVHVIAYVAVWVGYTDSTPEVLVSPDQAPDREQLVAFVDDHVKVELPPIAIVVGVAANATCGAVDATDTVTDAEALPPAPVHVIEYVDVLAGDTDLVPDVRAVPDQAPDFEQVFAFVDDQESFALCPTLIVVGVAPSETVGVFGGRHAAAAMRGGMAAAASALPSTRKSKRYRCDGRTKSLHVLQ